MQERSDTNSSTPPSVDREYRKKASKLHKEAKQAFDHIRDKNEADSRHLAELNRHISFLGTPIIPSPSQAGMYSHSEGQFYAE
jgi:hypothetical protein